MNRYRTFAFVVALPLLTSTGATIAAPNDVQPQSKVNLAFNRYYDYDEMTAALKSLVEAYPELLTMQSIGKSYEGRDMWQITLNNPATGPDTDKTAMYIDGNIHGNEVQASEVVLYTIWYLTKGHGKIEKITRLVDERAFYFVPMVNPDGRHYWFHAPNNPHSSRSGKRPVDSDRDGLFDEDGPDDLDGDGSICYMRKLDPNGSMRVSPDDPRLMTRITPNTTYDGQRYTLLGGEGIDNDGDGDINEDGPGGYDMNRNWPSDWQPDNIQFGAGEYPLSEPETRSIAAFVRAHPNIAAVQAYHNAGGMILRGPAASHLRYPRGDERTHELLQERGEKLLPFYRAMNTAKDLYTVHGGFKGWAFEGLGIFAFTNELWNDKQRYNRDADPSSLESLEFDDYLMFGQTYVQWKPFKHPVYGDIEIGGWTKYGSRVNPPFMLEETCHRNMAFTLFHADQMPLLEIPQVDVRDIGNGLLEVTVEVRNTRLIPSIAQLAAQNGIGRRDSITITAIGGGTLEVVGGGTIANRYDAPLRFVERQPQRLWVTNGIAGESAELFRWIVRGNGAARIIYRGDKAHAQRDIELKAD